MIQQKRKIVLASRSPARRKLLKDAGFKIGLAFADVDESQLKNEPVCRYAMRVALAKALKIAKKKRDAVIIAVDTIIAHDGHIFGKAKNHSDARKILKRLSGRWHEVYSGTIVLDAKTGKIIKKLIVSRVKFAKLLPSQINWYIKTGEPMKAAGAYSIQGKGRALIEAVDGCVTNVIGLSIPVITRMLKRVNAI